VITAEEAARLRPEEKDAILDAVLGMVWSDKKTQDEEVRLLRRLSRHFTDDDIGQLLVRYDHDPERVGRKIASSDLGPTGRRVLLRLMALVAAAADGIEEGELIFFQQMLRAFGVNDRERERLDRMAHAYIYAEAVRDALRSRGSDADVSDLEPLAERMGGAPERREALVRHIRIELEG
jgi:hypothetical protein